MSSNTITWLDTLGATENHLTGLLPDEISGITNLDTIHVSKMICMVPYLIDF